MKDCYIIPPVLDDSKAPLDHEISLALMLWAIENEREKGGGFIIRKDAEKVTQVSLLYRPIIIKKYGDFTLAFDGYGVSLTQFKFGVAPSLTYLRSYLLSDDWTSKPESFAVGLDRHAQDFEMAHEENTYDVRGWITEPKLVGALTALLNQSIASDSKPEILLQFLDFNGVSSSLDALDKIKRLLFSENTSLHDLKQVLNEKVSEVIDLLNKECSKIEKEYDDKINKITPSVLENKQKYENQRMNINQQIEARMSKKLHDLKNKLDEAVAKIDSYERSGRQPKGGIEKQYSIRNSMQHRIKELEFEKKRQTTAADKKYDALIKQEQERIDSLEAQRDQALEQPRNKIQRVTDSANRLDKAIDQLIEDHNSIVRMEASSSVIHPAQLGVDEFTLYLPTIVVQFDNGKRPRSTVFSAMTLKQSKGVVGALKEFLGTKSLPLEKADEYLAKFVASFMENPKVRTAALSIARHNNLLLDPPTKESAYSGISKLRARDLISQKEAVELQKAIEGYFVPTGMEGPSIQEGDFAVKVEEKEQRQPLVVRFVNYQGKEKLVGIEELEVLREQDQDEFNRQGLAMKDMIGEYNRLLTYLKGLKIPHTKQYCIDHKENWVQNQLYMALVNSEFQHDVRKERVFQVGEIEARIDFDVGGVGVEVKIFRSTQDFDRLAKEMLNYGEEYSSILIPYINAGGMSNEQLEAELKLLSKHYHQIKGYFPLNYSET